MSIWDDFLNWLYGIPHWFRRLPVVFNWMWFKVYHDVILHIPWHTIVAEFVRVGWDFMLFVTVCTFLLVVSRLVPRRTR